MSERPCPPPPVRVWIGGALYDVRAWIGIEGPGPAGSVLVRPLVWVRITDAPLGLDVEAPGPARRRAGPGSRAEERPAFRRWEPGA